MEERYYIVSYIVNPKKEVNLKGEYHGRIHLKVVTRPTIKECEESLNLIDSRFYSKVLSISEIYQEDYEYCEKNKEINK